MKALKIFPYFYLFIGLLFIYDGINKLVQNQEGYDFLWSFVIAVVAIFMFLFRKRYLKKFN
jgi:hypothetical protein